MDDCAFTRTERRSKGPYNDQEGIKNRMLPEFGSQVNAPMRVESVCQDQQRGFRALDEGRTNAV